MSDINDIFKAIEEKDADAVADWIHMQGFIQYKIDTLKHKEIDNSFENEKIKKELELEERYLIIFMSFFAAFCAVISVSYILAYSN